MAGFKFELDDFVSLKLPGSDDVGQVVAIITERQCTKYRVLWQGHLVEEHHISQLKEYTPPDPDKDDDDDDEIGV